MKLEYLVTMSEQRTSHTTPGNHVIYTFEMQQVRTGTGYHLCRLPQDSDHDPERRDREDKGQGMQKTGKRGFLN